MTDPTLSSDDIAQLAHMTLAKTLGLKRGESVLIESWTNSLPYAEAFQLEARRLGAKPLILFESEKGYWDAVGSLKAKELGEPGKSEWAALENADAYVYFWGPADRARVESLPDKVRGALFAYNQRWYQLVRKNGIRACRVELALAEAGNAQRLGVDLGDWRRELLAGSLVDPAILARNGARVAKALTRGKKLHVIHPNGTDLWLGLRGRPVTVDDGRVDAEDLKKRQNIVSLPGGSALVAVDEKVAEGVFAANRPSRFERVVPSTGGRWEFKGGKMLTYQFEQGEEVFVQGFQEAPKGKERPGLFEVGLNPAVRDAPNFEDQQEGVVTLYIGGNKSWGGTNGVPYMGYLVLRGATVEIDGRPLVRDGAIV
jgi:leucyl aminopeptidase (aminopeptidase T)